jgi:hypothetical protein
MSARGTLHGLLALGVTIKPLTRDVRGALRPSPFKAEWSKTKDALHRELYQYGAEVTVLEVDLRPHDFKQNGAPRGDQRAPWSAGVRLTFRAAEYDGEVLTFDAGEFSRWEDNVRALALSLEALRKADRYGITAGKQMAGFKALPVASTEPSPERGRRLIVEHGGVRAALHATHPDHGGNASDFADVQAARGAS